MTKVTIIGNVRINGRKSYKERATGYMDAFRNLGAQVEYKNIHRFSYKVARGGVAVSYDGKPFGDTDIIFVHAINSDFLLQYLESFRLLKTKCKVIVNSPESILNAKNKFATAVLLKKAGVPIPKTGLVTSMTWKNAADGMSFPVIVKKVSGSRGMGVMKFDSYNSLTSFFDFYFKGNRDPQGLLVQEYIRESDATDYRVVVVNGKVIFTMQRKGPDPEKNFRSNVAQGAIPSAFQADKKMINIAIKANKALGLFYSGVDIMKAKDGYKVLEVNCTPFTEVEQSVSDKNLYEAIAKECLGLLRKKKA